MSSIFKTRKIPKHLIIQEEFDFHRKSRPSLWRVLFWALMAGLATLVFLQVRGTLGL